MNHLSHQQIHRHLHTAIDRSLRRAHWALRFLRSHARALIFLFALVVVPLIVFGEVADEIDEVDGGALPVDVSIMMTLRQWDWAGFEASSLLLADVGYKWGVVPFDVALIALLFVAGRIRKGLFFASAVGGSALLNLAAKAWFARERPSLWEAIVHESTYSFPSGHAMGSATLAFAVIALTWDTRARWPVLAAALLFAIAVALSRVWLGVHYPSDILAAWAAAAAWVFGLAHLFRLHQKARTQPAPPPTDGKPS